jgi:glutathione synthase/RimK-type ligase-like ATP-grasp enzyme
MNNTIILLDTLNDWKPYYATNSILTVSDYLKNKSLGRETKLVINLSNDYSYNSEGYYSSLLAQARGHRVIPDVEVINRLKSGTGLRMDMNLHKLCYQWIQKNNITGNWYLTVCFGACREKGLEKIARYIFDNYPAPLLRICFNDQPKNQIDNIQSLPINGLNEEEQDFFASTLDNFYRKIWRTRSHKSSRFSLAVLYDPSEKFPPSNKRALKKILDVAKKMNVHAELITEEESTRLMEFDALFIRTTTSLNHYTYQLSQKAAQNEIAVIDDPVSIIRCTNKVYLNELLEKEKIPAPLSMLIFRSNENTFESISAKLGSPFILKIPDGSFSHGVDKIANEKELEEAFAALFRKSSILLAQEFIPTDFDWRIGILNGEPLFACKYYMAKGHWQIYHHDNNGTSEEGYADTIPIYKVPPQVLKTALKATSLIGNGLYGVDLKVVNGKVAVIEINDNPSIDHGLEDAILGDDLYYRIINHFSQLIDEYYR